MLTKRTAAVLLLVVSVGLIVWAVFLRRPSRSPRRAITPRQDETRLRRGNAFEQRDAVRRLGKQKEEDAIPLIETVLESSDRGVVKFEAIRTLADIGGPRAVPPLKKALRDEDAFIRSTAARVLGTLGRKDPEVVPKLCSAVGDPDQRVMYAACRSLGKLGDPRAVPTLAPLARGSSEIHAYIAVYALGKFRCREAAIALRDAFDASSSEEFQMKVLSQLCRAGTRETIGELETRLRSRRWSAEMREVLEGTIYRLRVKYGLPAEVPARPPGVNTPDPVGGKKQ